MDKERAKEIELAIGYLSLMHYDGVKFFPRHIKYEDIPIVITQIEEIFAEKNISGVHIEYIDGYFKRISDEQKFTDRFSIE